MNLPDQLINRMIRYSGGRHAVAHRASASSRRANWPELLDRRIEVPRNPWDIVIGDGVALEDHVAPLTRRFKYLAAFPFLAAMIKACSPKRSKATALDE
jgi:hypothetical protein